MNSPAVILFVSVAVGSVLEVVAFVLSIASAGAGHGSYFYAKVFFPFMMILAEMNHEIPMWAAIASLLQFPAYGWLVGRKPTPIDRIRTALITTGIHLVAVKMAFDFKGGFE